MKTQTQKFMGHKTTILKSKFTALSEQESKGKPGQHHFINLKFYDMLEMSIKNEKNNIHKEQAKKN